MSRLSNVAELYRGAMRADAEEIEFTEAALYEAAMEVAHARAQNIDSDPQDEVSNKAEGEFKTASLLHMNAHDNFAESRLTSTAHFLANITKYKELALKEAKSDGVTINTSESGYVDSVRSVEIIS